MPRPHCLYGIRVDIPEQRAGSSTRIGKSSPRNFYHPLSQTAPLSLPLLAQTQPGMQWCVSTLPPQVKPCLQIRKLLLRVLDQVEKYSQYFEPRERCEQSYFEVEIGEGTSKECWVGLGSCRSWERHQQVEAICFLSKSSLLHLGECPSLSRSEKDLGKGCKSQKNGGSLLPPTVCQGWRKRFPTNQAAKPLLSFENIVHRLNPKMRFCCCCVSLR